MCMVVWLIVLCVFVIVELESLPDADVERMFIPAPRGIEAQADIILFREHVAEARAYAGQQFVKLTDLRGHAANAGERDQAEPFREPPAILGLQRKHQFIAITARGVAAQVGARSERREREEGRVTAGAPPIAANRQHMVRGQFKIAVVSHGVSLEREVAAKRVVKEVGFDNRPDVSRLIRDYFADIRTLKMQGVRRPLLNSHKSCEHPRRIFRISCAACWPDFRTQG